MAIHENISFNEYLALPGLNASKLKPYSKSVRYGVWKEQKGFKQSRAMALGSLAHCLVLEGEAKLTELINSEFITEGWPVNTTTNKPYGETSGKWLNWLETTDQNKKVMLPEQLDNVKAMTKAIAEHPAAMQILNQCDKRETAVTWTCEYTGELMKALLDGFGSGVIMDLKTIGKQLSAKMLEREMYDRQYHMQFSMYADGLHMNGFDTEFFVIFVQSKDEMDVCAALVDHAALEQGRSDYIKAVENYKKREEPIKTGLFPAILDLSIPYYAIEELQDNADFVNEVKGVS